MSQNEQGIHQVCLKVTLLTTLLGAFSPLIELGQISQNPCTPTNVWRVPQKKSQIIIIIIIIHTHTLQTCKDVVLMNKPFITH
jgi:hypothetical protein